MTYVNQFDNLAREHGVTVDFTAKCDADNAHADQKNRRVLLPVVTTFSDAELFIVGMHELGHVLGTPADERLMAEWRHFPMPSVACCAYILEREHEAWNWAAARVPADMHPLLESLRKTAVATYERDIAMYEKARCKHEPGEVCGFDRLREVFFEAYDQVTLLEGPTWIGRVKG